MNNTENTNKIVQTAQVDNTNNNNIIESKVVIEDEFRRVQEESKRVANQEQQLYRSGSKRINARTREGLPNVFRRVLDSRNDEFGYGDELHLKSQKVDTTFDIYQNVDVQTFHDIFEINKKSFKKW